jgi:hypothetical protein
VQLDRSANRWPDVSATVTSVSRAWAAGASETTSQRLWPACAVVQRGGFGGLSAPVQPLPDCLAPSLALVRSPRARRRRPDSSSDASRAWIYPRTTPRRHTPGECCPWGTPPPASRLGRAHRRALPPGQSFHLHGCGFGQGCHNLRYSLWGQRQPPRPGTTVVGQRLVAARSFT